MSHLLRGTFCVYPGDSGGPVYANLLNVRVSTGT